MIKPGTRVVRGPNWCYKFEDNGEGFLGTIVPEKDCVDRKVKVIWDSGRTSRYRADTGQYDLRVFDTAPAGEIHYGEKCRACKEEDIHGMVWRCCVCKHVTLCSPCYMNGYHDLSHPFERMLSNRLFKLPPRANSQNCKRIAKGLFPGAEVVRGPDWQMGNEDGNDFGYVEEISSMIGSYRGAVSVYWIESDEVYYYSVGSKGQVEVIFSRLTETASGGYYYADHLPVVEFSCISYDSDKHVDSVDGMVGFDQLDGAIIVTNGHTKTTPVNQEQIQPTTQNIERMTPVKQGQIQPTTQNIEHSRKQDSKDILATEAESGESDKKPNEKKDKISKQIEDVKNEKQKKAEQEQGNTNQVSCDSLESRKKFVKEHYQELPENLKLEYLDATILYHEEDRNLASDFLGDIGNTNASYKVSLYDDINHDTGSKLQHLQKMCDRSMLIFVLFTTRQYETEEEEQEWDILCEEILFSENVVPVKASGNFKLPLGFKSTKPLDFFSRDSSYFRSLKSLLFSCNKKRLYMEKELTEDQYTILKERFC